MTRKKRNQKKRKQLAFSVLKENDARIIIIYKTGEVCLVEIGGYLYNELHLDLDKHKRLLMKNGK